MIDTECHIALTTVLYFSDYHSQNISDNNLINVTDATIQILITI